MKISLHATNVNTLDSIIKNKIKNELATWDGYFGSNGASHIGLLVPGKTVQMVPL